METTIKANVVQDETCFVIHWRTSQYKEDRGTYSYYGNISCWTEFPKSKVQSVINKFGKFDAVEILPRLDRKLFSFK